MERISESRAVELARAFVAEAGLGHCGDVRHSFHMPFEFLKSVGATSKRSKSGHYVVSFTYTGPPCPPEWEGMVPAWDDGTSVTVDDLTGKCEVMPKL